MSSQFEQQVQMAIAEAKLGNRKKARAILGDVARREPGNARAWYLFSQVVERPAEAVDCLRKVLEIDPDNLQALDRLERYQSDPQALKGKRSSGSTKLFAIVGGLLMIGLCVGVPLCVFAGLATTGYIAAPAALLGGQVDKQATVEQALAATLAKIPTYTSAPTRTATATATPTVTRTATAKPTETLTVTPTSTGKVEAGGAPAGALGCVPWNNPVEPGIVTRVIDGDTIEAFVDGRTVLIRYIGIDTPETVHPTKGVQYFGLEAKEMNRQLVEGKAVFLVKDVSDMDQYGRLLRYVMMGELYGQFVNYELVRQGYASASTYPPDVACAQAFLAAQQQAQTAGIGLWGPTPTAGLQPPSRSGGGNCDPAYPEVCIPSPPPLLNCKDVTYRNLKVLPPDPHGFDANHDGVGCEDE